MPITHATTTGTIGETQWNEAHDLSLFTPSEIGAVSGTGTAGRVAEFSDSDTIQAANLIAPSANILTLTNAAASTLALNITSAKTLTLTAADNYTLTIPATGTAALLGTANVFTAAQTISMNAAALSVTNTQTNAAGGVVNLTATASINGNNLGVINFINSASGSTGAQIKVIANNSTSGSDLIFYTHTGSALTEGLRISKAQVISFAQNTTLLINSTSSNLSYFDITHSSPVGSDASYGGFRWKLGSSVALAVDVARINMIRDGAATDGAGIQIFTKATGGSITERMRIKPTGEIGIGTTSPLTKLHITSDTAATNTVVNVLTVEQTSTGTAAAGLGAGLLYSIETATGGTMQTAGQIAASWVGATNATRKAKLSLSAYDTAARLGLEIEASGTEPMLGFYGVAPIARAVLATGAGASVDDVITALQNLGLVKQS